MKNILTERAISHYKYGISHDIFAEPVTTYAKLSIEALEKRLPQKPILVDGRHKCPSCYANDRSLDYFCDKCGQALDWSEIV